MEEAKIMNYVEINKDRWKVFFDALSRYSFNKEDVELKFISSLVGDQVIETSTPFMGMTYDPKYAELNIFLRSTEHTVKHPKKIVLGQFDRSLMSISIEDMEGNIHSIEFAQPIWLDFEVLKTAESHSESRL